MKSYCLILILLIVQSTQAQTTGASIPSNPALRQEILDRFKQAEDIRARLMRCNFPCEGSFVYERMRKMDAANAARLREIVRQYGWPGSDIVGEDGTAYALALVLNADDHALKVELLPLVRAAYRAGKTPGSSYAVLMDSILVGEGKPQVYGTSVEADDKWRDGEPTLRPIEDAANVDKRRAEVGLPPLSAYLESLRKRAVPQSTKRP